MNHLTNMILDSSVPYLGVGVVRGVAGGELLVDVVGDVAGLEPAADGDGVDRLAVAGLLLLLGHGLAQLQVVHLGAQVVGQRGLRRKNNVPLVKVFHSR